MSDKSGRKIAPFTRHFTALLIAAAILLTAMLAPQTAHADSVYSWEDAEGRLHYGPKPPAGANNIKGVSEKTFSRYSSDRMLKRMGWKNGKPPQTPQPLFNNTKTNPSALEQGELSVTYNDTGELTSCAVLVHNKSKDTARGVTVSFEFKDGTLIPAIGPDTIQAESRALYAVSPEQLPIAIRLEDIPSANAEDAKPKVEISSEG